MALEFAKKKDFRYPEAWKESGMAGDDWYYRFLGRYPNNPLRKVNKLAVESGPALSEEDKPQPIVEVFVKSYIDTKMETKEEIFDPIENYCFEWAEVELEDLDTNNDC